MASIYLDKLTMATTICTDCTMIFIAFIGQAGTLTFIKKQNIYCLAYTFSSRFGNTDN